MKNIILIMISALILLSASLIFSNPGEEGYALALKAAKAGNKDIAFMHFLSILNNLKSEHREEALFVCAEYYFSISDFHDALSTLSKFISEYPDSKMKPFVLFYLLKIARDQGNESLAQKIEKEIINLKQLVMVFKNQRDLKYKSPLGTKYRLIYYIDRIEFYVDGKISWKFSY